MSKKKKMPPIEELAVIEYGEGAYLKRVLCIDPGLEGTGLAFWETINLKSVPPQGYRPSHVKPITAGRVREWRDKVGYIREHFKTIINIWQPQHVILEFQELWAGSATSFASGTSGSLSKLTYLTGQLACLSEIVTGEEALLVTPAQWKGQLSKKAVDSRIKRALGINRKYPNHVSDAVGMGIALQGKL